MRRDYAAGVLRERILLSIAAWGPAAGAEWWRVLRRVSRADALVVRQALIEAGMARAEVEGLLGGRHPAGCACWKCVLRLHAWVLKSRQRWKDRDADIAAKRKIGV